MNEKVASYKGTKRYEYTYTVITYDCGCSITIGAYEKEEEAPRFCVSHGKYIRKIVRTTTYFGDFKNES